MVGERGGLGERDSLAVIVGVFCLVDADARVYMVRIFAILDRNVSFFVARVIRQLRNVTSNLKGGTYTWGRGDIWRTGYSSMSWLSRRRFLPSAEG